MACELASGWAANCLALGNSVEADPMTTVQFAIRDRDFASRVSALLIAEGHFTVLMVDRPDPGIPGLMVIGADLVDVIQPEDAERVVVIARDPEPRDANSLWNAG